MHEVIDAPRPLPPKGTEISTPAIGVDTHLIDLPTALRLADGANPEIGLARERINESLALLQGARALLLPTLNAGTNYHLHNGALQRARGAILALSEQSVYFGGGARTVAAESVAFPAIRIFSHLGDAVLEPLAARQQTAVRNFDAGATTNSILLGVSTRYLDLMAAEARMEVLRQSRRDIGEVVRVTNNFAMAGQGRQADADRARTEASLIDSELQRVSEQVAVAAAELTKILSLDPSVRLRTVGGPIPVLQLVDTNDGLEQLIEVAIRRRPELAARSEELAENQTRYRQERTRPFFPTISVGFSGGGFGGGSNFTIPTFGTFAGRTDFDVLAYWTVQNFGVGNAAIQNGRRAQTDQAVAARVRTLNLVRREVADAYASVLGIGRQLAIFEKRLAFAEAGLQEELNRIRGGEGLPIELLDSLSRAVTARQALVAAIAAYDQAQFRLFVALGQPPTPALPEVQSLASPAHN